MTTAIRHGAILDIIGRRPVSSQKDLVRALGRRGFQVSQATVSRDVRRLGLLKVPLAGGGFRYAPAEQAAGPVRPDVERAMRMFVTGVSEGEALLVLKTRSGNANALAVVIDQADWPDVAGTIAGDDTVLLVLKSAAARDRIRESLAALLETD
ncbi:MAG: arginine repressor [Acidobacteriota bacterium]|nr:arginine repressor [Acidobacteriota bacterium]